MRNIVLVCLFVAVAPIAHGYVSPAPRYINVELTFADSTTGTNRTETGQLWFGDLPIETDDGRVIGFGKIAHYDGIKWFVPKTPGDIWIERPTPDLGPNTLMLHDYQGERPIKLAFEKIGVGRTVDAQLDSKMDETAKSIDNARPSSELSVPKMDDILDESEVVVAPVNSTLKGSQEETIQATKNNVPLKFATEKDIGAKEITVASLRKIVFLDASNNIKRDSYGGRYVSYANQATGDQGRVQVVAATFFGGPSDQERFTFARILDNGDILVGGQFHDLDFVDPSLIRVVGKDPNPDAYPPVERNDHRNRPYTDYPKRTPTFVRYTADLQKIKEVFRLAWGAGSLGEANAGPNESLYVTGIVGPHFDTLAKDIPNLKFVANPDALVPDKNGKTREHEPDGYIVKIASDRKTLAWAVRFKHGAVKMFARSDGRIVCCRGNTLYFIDQDGNPSEGPTLEQTGTGMTMDPRTGDIYFGGSYRSATGREPYVCPYMFKLNPEGKIEWTGYSWTGPVVGVDQLRLVSDSSVSRILVRDDGKLLVSGWSDGGNTVLAYQPYDLRRKIKDSGGFCSSTWGASGLTVRIANLWTMDPKTMEVDFHTQYVGYVPTSDLPTLINIYSMYPMANGEIAVTGGGWIGFVETHDAWVKPWYIENRTDEHVHARGGPFFTLFTPDFKKARIATFTPHVHGLQIAGRGDMLLLYGSAGDLKSGEVDKKWNRKYPAIIRNALQPKIASTTDAYLVLVNTQGSPNPPVIPKLTWGPKATKGVK